MSRDTAFSQTLVNVTSPIKQAGDPVPRGDCTMTQGLKLGSPIAGSCSASFTVIMLVTGDFEGPAAKVSVMQFQ